jgi:hypothetical protein
MLDIGTFDPQQLQGLLVIVAPVLVELVSRLSERVLGQKIPFAFVTKPILSAIFAAIIGMLTDLGTGAGAVAGLAGSVGYGIKQYKSKELY